MFVKRYSRYQRRKAAPKRAYAPKRTYGKRKSGVKRAIRKFANPARCGRGLPGYPVNNIVRLRYCSNQTLQLGTGSNEMYPIKCNDIFSPNSTSASDQPSLFNQWAKLYNHYMVVGARITATFMIPSAGATASSVPQTMFVRIDDDATFTGIGTGNQFRLVTQTGKTHYKTLMQGTNPQKVVLRGWYNPRQFFGVTDPMDAQTRIGAPCVGSPPELAYWLVGGVTNDNSAGGSNGIDLTITVDYFVKFSEPTDQSVLP